LVLILAACGDDKGSDDASVSVDASVGDLSTLGHDLSTAAGDGGADLSQAAMDLSMGPDLYFVPNTSGDMAFQGVCMAKEAHISFPAIPARGWAYGSLNAAFDYSQAPTVTLVATMPAATGNNFDAIYLMSDGTWATMDNGAAKHAARVTQLCAATSVVDNVFDVADITMGESSDGRAVACALDGTLKAIEAGNTSSAFGSISGCQAVVQMPSGDLAVLRGDTNTVYRVDAATGASLGTLATGAPTTITLSMGPDQAAYVSEFTGGAIWRAPFGGAFTKVAATASDHSFEGMVVLPNGDLLLGDLTTASVVRVSASTGQQVGSTAATSISGGTRSLQLAPNGSVYVAGSQSVYRLDFPKR
jgi:hypothetical protein